MRAADVIGRKIVHVSQQMFWNEHLMQSECALNSMELDNGTRIFFHAVETLDCPTVTSSTVRPKRKRTK